MNLSSTHVIPATGTILTNDEIVSQFSVGNMGGMRRSKSRNLLVLISNPFKGLYVDRWENDTLHYTGMGKEGEQSIDSGQNKTLLESGKTGIKIHLLEAREEQRYTYLGEVYLADKPYQEIQFDENGHERGVWMFPLRLVSNSGLQMPSVEQILKIQDHHAKIAAKLSIKELRARALKAKEKPLVKNSQSVVYLRNAAVAEYVKRLADGTCDLCQKAAPFYDKNKLPYLECHHLIWLAHGGEDTIENTVALCPNCHRRMHVLDASADREKLLSRIKSRIAT